MSPKVSTRTEKTAGCASVADVLGATVNLSYLFPHSPNSSSLVALVVEDSQGPKLGHRTIT